MQTNLNNGIHIHSIDRADIKVDDLHSLGSGGVERIGSDHEINMINTISPIENNRVSPSNING